MNYWRAFVKFLVTVVGGVSLVLGIFEWGVKLRVSTWVIPDWILLTLIVLLLAVAAHTAYWVNRYGKLDSRRDKPKKAKLKPTKEHMFILSALADSDDQCALRRYLQDCYLAVFNDKTITDFNLVFSELRERGYIIPHGSDIDPECSINAAGLNYFKEHLKKVEDKEGRIPPIPAEIKKGYQVAEDF